MPSSGKAAGRGLFCFDFLVSSGNSPLLPPSPHLCLWVEVQHLATRATATGFSHADTQARGSDFSDGMRAFCALLSACLLLAADGFVPCLKHHAQRAGCGAGVNAPRVRARFCPLAVAGSVGKRPGQSELSGATQKTGGDDDNVIIKQSTLVEANEQVASAPLSPSPCPSHSELTLSDSNEPQVQAEALQALLLSRRTVNDFDAELPAGWESALERAVNVATFAPNHKRTEPWRFHLLGPQAIAKVCALNAQLVAEKKGPEAAEKKLARWMQMKGWLVVTQVVSGRLALVALPSLSRMTE